MLMSRRHPVLYRATRAFMSVAALAASAGCGGGGYGEGVRFTARTQTRVDEVLVAGERLTLPKDQPYSITDTQRRSEGNGTADATAAVEGTARCHAAVNGKGTAAAEFQLGHMLFNGEDQPLEVTVICDCAFAYEIQREPGTAPELIGLKFYVKDSNRRVLRREVFVAPEGDLAASRHSSHEIVSFNITLEPGLAYQLVLAGRVDVTGQEDTSPLAATIEVSQCNVSVAAR